LTERGSFGLLSRVKEPVHTLGTFDKPGTTTGPPASRPASILLVDDKADHLRALEVSLETLGLRIVTALSGEGALKQVLREDFAVILLDMQMPILDGAETARLIKGRERSRHTPIIFLTADDDSAEVVARAYRHGAVDFMSKPINVDILRSKVMVFVEFYLRGEEIKRQKALLREHAIELEARAKELERSNTELERFAYVASHDLQEPLRMVSSYTQLLQRRYKGRLDQDADEFIAFAVDGVTRMQLLINDLLDYSRVGSRGKELVPTASAVMLDRALANLQPSIEETGAVVTRSELPVVLADPTQLVQLFQNLIGNAIKFHSEAAPRVDVSAIRRGARWELAVADNGIGIEPQYHDRIFVIFQRLHTKERYPGTGIGLAICKKIVERHQGTLSVESRLGGGSTFRFTLAAVE
jgi:two-component system sensor histidine kinase/response regulator